MSVRDGLEYPLSTALICFQLIVVCPKHNVDTGIVAKIAVLLVDCCWKLPGKGKVDKNLKWALSNAYGKEVLDDRVCKPILKHINKDVGLMAKARA